MDFSLLRAKKDSRKIIRLFPFQDKAYRKHGSGINALGVNALLTVKLRY